MNITGTLTKKMEERQISPNFKVREFVIGYAENPLYPQAIIFQLSNDKTTLLDNIPEGTEVVIHFNLRGREWTKPGTNETRYFNSLEAWKIETPGKDPNSQPITQSQTTAAGIPAGLQKELTLTDTKEDLEDLPF